MNQHRRHMYINKHISSVEGFVIIAKILETVRSTERSNR